MGTYTVVDRVSMLVDEAIEAMPEWIAKSNVEAIKQRILDDLAAMPRGSEDDFEIELHPCSRCRNCDLHEEEHADTKCLFLPTHYESNRCPDRVECTVKLSADVKTVQAAFV